MKKGQHLKGILAGALLAGSTFGALCAAEKGDLLIHIEGIRNNEGMIMIALTETANPTDRKFVKANLAKADSSGVRFFFNDLPEGILFIQAYHDGNGNFKLDTTPDGKPAEGVAGFKESPERPSVKIGEEKAEATIHMLYLQ